MDIVKYLRYLLSLSLVLVFLLHITGTVYIDMLMALENKVYDLRLQLTLPDEHELDKHVVIIDIDEKALGAIGQWPWNRDVMADIVDSLFDHYDVREVGFDIVFAEEDIDQGAKVLEKMALGSMSNNETFLNEYEKALPSLQRDAEFALSLSNRKTILGYVIDKDVAKGALPDYVTTLDKVTQEAIPFMPVEGYAANLAVLQESAYSGGFFTNPLLDDDGVFRRVPLLQERDGKLYESLALAIVRTALGSPPIELSVVTDGSDENMMFLEYVKLGELSIPVDDHSGVLVPYIGTQKSFDYVSAVDVLNKTVDKKMLSDKIALFGTSAQGLLDLRTTPLETAFPGVEVHANIIQGILDNRIMHQPGYTQGLEFLLVLVLGVLLTIIIPMLSPVWGLFVSIFILCLLIATNLYMWESKQLVYPLGTPGLLVVLMFTLQMTYGFFVESRGKRQLAHLFGQYVPPELVEEMSKAMKEISLDGEIREMSVLFSDVRGFTTISENLEPKELTDYINGFLTPITEVIHNERGTIDKYMGDAVMAFWGAPLEDDQHALHSLTAAYKMTIRMKTLSEEFKAKGWPELKVGIGVNTGKMNVGNKGSEFRVDYTVLGDAVNLGSRLEGLTKEYGVDIITSENTKYAVPEFEFRELDTVQVKGKDESIKIYEPLGLLENVDKAVRKDLRRFHQALKYYRGRHWDDAEREIFSLSQQEPDRKIYQIYLDRIMKFRENPPPDDWDGTERKTTK